MNSQEIYIAISLLLFAVGLAVVITKRNAIFVLIGIELMLNAANVNFLSFNYFGVKYVEGHIFALFVIMLAAAEAAIALAIVLKVVRYYKTSNLDEIDTLKH